jgi:hypothetical protein
MKTWKLTPSACPHCGYVMDAASKSAEADDEGGPGPGAISLCFNCAAVNQFVEGEEEGSLVIGKFDADELEGEDREVVMGMVERIKAMLATKQILKDAHKLSSQHREQVLANNCGCFGCISVFRGDRVEEWVDDGQTALCPVCGIDTVLPQTEDLKWATNKEFLADMKKMWLDERVAQ